MLLIKQNIYLIYNWKTNLQTKCQNVFHYLKSKYRIIHGYLSSFFGNHFSSKNKKQIKIMKTEWIKMLTDTASHEHLQMYVFICILYCLSGSRYHSYSYHFGKKKKIKTHVIYTTWSLVNIDSVVTITRSRYIIKGNKIGLYAKK